MFSSCARSKRGSSQANFLTFFNKEVNREAIESVPFGNASPLYLNLPAVDSRNKQLFCDCWHAGKLTAAVAGAQALVTSGHWASAFYLDLAGCTSAAAVTFAMLAAFGIPADAPDLNPLQARTCRVYSSGCLVLCELT